MSVFEVPFPENEPVRNYEPGSDDRAQLQKALADLKSNPLDIPLVIDGEEIKTGKTIQITAPHNHKMVLGQYHQGGPEEIKRAVTSALEAQKGFLLRLSTPYLQVSAPAFLRLRLAFQEQCQDLFGL